MSAVPSVPDFWSFTYSLHSLILKRKRSMLNAVCMHLKFEHSFNIGVRTRTTKKEDVGFELRLSESLDFCYV